MPVGDSCFGQSKGEYKSAHHQILYDHFCCLISLVK